MSGREQGVQYELLRDYQRPGTEMAAGGAAPLSVVVSPRREYSDFEADPDGQGQGETIPSRRLMHVCQI